MSSGYLTIEEAAQKLGRPPSWVKGQICEGKLGATLAGGCWLISSEDLDKLLSSDSPTPQPNNTVHDFLPERPKRKSRAVPNHQITTKQSEVMAIWRKLELGERPETIQAMYHALLSRSPYIKQHLRSVGAVDALRKLAQIPERIRALEKAAQLREHERQQARGRFLGELGLRDRFVEDFLGTDNFFESSLARHTSFDEADLQGLRRTYEHEKSKFVHAWVKGETGARLDTEQTAAVAAVHGHVQVVARAGSGKTTVLVSRALFLQKHCGISPDEMLLLTFNRDAAREVVDRLGKMVDGYVPHVMTFHALAHAIVHPEESLLHDGPSGENQNLSRVFQQVIDDHLQVPVFKAQIRDLMLAHFRRDWERIVAGGYDKGKEELLRFRRSLPHESLRGEYLKSYGEKVIADFLFEHDVPYKYERNHWWGGLNYRPDFTVFQTGKSGAIIEYFGMQGDPDYDEMSEAKRDYWARKPNWVLLEFSPRDITANGVEAFRERLKGSLEELGVPCNRLSDEEIWHRVRDRAIDRFTNACVGFVGRCRKRSLFASELDTLIERHTALSDVEGMFLRIISTLYGAYLARLAATGEEDFDGLMQRAAETVAGGETLFERKLGRGDVRKLRYVFIDEFQDFSELFHRLVSAMQRQNPHVEFFCVGDDWQGINGFAGSDPKFFRDFGDYFGASRRLSISTNYRSPRSIVGVGNALMAGRGAPAVARKPSSGQVLLSDLAEFEPSLLEKQRHSGDVITPIVLRLASKALEDGLDVVLLCRRNRLPWFVDDGGRGGAPHRNLERYLDIIRAYFPRRVRGRITISTVHKYKGREKPVVIVLDAVARSYPLLHPDWIFSRILGESLQKMVEEERRLLYVALTRAAERLVVVTERGSNSPFLNDIQRRMTLPKIDWATFPPVGGKTARLVVKVGNQEFRGSAPTFAVRDVLRAEGYQWQTTGWKGWAKSFPAAGFSVGVLKAEKWAATADGIEVRVFNDYDTLVARYIVDGGRWNELEKIKEVRL